MYLAILIAVQPSDILPSCKSNVGILEKLLDDNPPNKIGSMIPDRPVSDPSTEHCLCGVVDSFKSLLMMIGQFSWMMLPRVLAEHCFCGSINPA
jgi:hypothetical protein